MQRGWHQVRITTSQAGGENVLRPLTTLTSDTFTICLHLKYNTIPGTSVYIRGIYSCAWRFGCFPGVGLLGTWYFQIAIFHLQLIMALFTLYTFFHSWTSVAGGVCRSPSEAPCTTYEIQDGWYPNLETFFFQTGNKRKRQIVTRKQVWIAIKSPTKAS